MKFKSIQIREIFKPPQKGKFSNSAVSSNGTIPLISAKKGNNGIAGFINTNKVTDSKKTYSNAITVANTGQGGVGIAFYHNYEFAPTNNVTVLELKDTDILTQFSGLIIATAITKQRAKFSYGYILNDERLNALKIVLPVNSGGKFEVQYLNKYGQNKAQKVKNKVKHPKLNEITDYRSLDEVEWKEFDFNSVFTIDNGVRLVEKDRVKGEYPFIGAAKVNNGVVGFVGNKNESLDKNVLGVNYDGEGGMVYNFYHPYYALFSDSVKRIHFKDFEGNKYHYLFVKTMIFQQREKYTYGYKFNSKRMNRQKIMLPVKNDEKTDWDFIEQYMKRLENKVIEQSNLRQNSYNYSEI